MHIYSPNAYKFTYDHDNDGILDSVNAVNYYNNARFRHNSYANFLFADGSVRAISLLDWVRNKDGLWGPK